MPHASLVFRALRVAALRLSVVCICAGTVSYIVNRMSIEDSVRKQLVLSTEQRLEQESQPFREVRELQRNFLDDFLTLDTDQARRPELVRDFAKVFVRHADGSYTQRPGLFEGAALNNGRRFANMSATYAPENPPDDDVKARFMLSYLLSHKYGSVARGRLFNFYGVVPEKGFPIYQSEDIAKVFKYDGPDKLKLETYEFFWRGFSQRHSNTIYTAIYWDQSNAAWMTTIATPDIPDDSGRHRIMACVDMPLDDLMLRTAKPTLPGSRSTILADDEIGTLIFDSVHADAIKRGEGRASVESLGISHYRPLVEAGQRTAAGTVTLIDNGQEIVAVGRIPETPWLLAVHYPKSRIRPAILSNLGIVIAIGLLTLIVEIFILRSILQTQVAEPLRRLIRATQMVGRTAGSQASYSLPTQSNDEIGQLARDFAQMAQRVCAAHASLEQKVRDRTSELEELNQLLLTTSMTDEMTGLANRRRFDNVLWEGIARVREGDSILMLAMIDVDWFKDYNDCYGHPAGDACLRQIAKILSLNVKRTGDLVARYGGEEFAVITVTRDKDDAVRFCKDLCVAVANAHIAHERSPFGCVTLSIGIAFAMPSDQVGPEYLLQEADRALYGAKANGRNCAVLSARGSEI